MLRSILKASRKWAPFFIFGLAFFVRVYRLDLVPLNHDEANWIIPCVDNFDRFFGVPVSGFGGNIRPFLSWFVGLSKIFFSSPEYIVRVPAAIIGTATVMLLYYLAKEMYGKGCGIVSALLLVFLPWHIIQSRDGREMVTTTFFSCLITLSLIKALKKQNNAWFIAFWLFLGLGSFYTYALSILFLPIFFIMLLFLRKELSWIRPGVYLLGVIIILAQLYPLVYLYFIGHLPALLEKVCYYVGGNQAILIDGPNRYLGLIIENFRNNAPLAVKSLFFTSGGRLLYAASLGPALLITPLSLVLVLFSLGICFYRRKIADVILLVWFIVGSLGCIFGVRFFEARHYIIILIPLLIMISMFIVRFFAIRSTSYFGRNLFIAIGVIFIMIVVVLEVSQTLRYYTVAPTNIEECRRNSYGGKEAALYLLNVVGIEDSQILSDVRMSLCTYLKYFSDNRITCKQDYSSFKQRKYFVIWAPESHLRDYWGGLFSGLYSYFKQRYPDVRPVKTIYYPNGLAAIHIFKVEDR